MVPDGTPQIYACSFADIFLRCQLWGHVRSRTGVQDTAQLILIYFSRHPFLLWKVWKWYGMGSHFSTDPSSYAFKVGLSSSFWQIINSPCHEKLHLQILDAQECWFKHNCTRQSRKLATIVLIVQKELWSRSKTSVFWTPWGNQSSM